MTETRKRLMLRPHHSSMAASRIIITANSDMEAHIRELQRSTEEELFKITTLETYFNPNEKIPKQRITPKKNINEWFDKLNIFHTTGTAPLTIESARLKRGDFFRFKGEVKVRVFDYKNAAVISKINPSKNRKAEYHYHLWEDTNNLGSTTNGNRLIETDFEF